MRRNILNDREREVAHVVSWKRVAFALGLTSVLAAAGCQDRMLDPVIPSSDDGTALPFEESTDTPALLASVG